MMKKSTKLLSVMFTLALLVGILPTAAFAIAGENIAENEPVNSIETNEYLKDIPIYLTYINSNGEESFEMAKESSMQAIRNAVNGISVMTENLNDKYAIVLVPDNIKETMLTDPIFSNTFDRIRELVAGGTTVNYVNFFLKGADGQASTYSVMATTGQEDSTEYWESRCPSLGTYKGYKFLYMESSVGIETNLVEVKNISGSMSWKTLIKKTVVAVADEVINNAVYKKARLASEVLSAAFSAYTPPFDVTYSTSRGYLKGRVSGDLYMKSVLIRDDLDRIPGYAYYSWGHTERLVSALRMEAKYPISKNASGTYNYEYPTYTGARRITVTRGYYGDNTLYDSIIALYENTTAYRTHSESIDVNNSVSSLLS